MYKKLVKGIWKGGGGIFFNLRRRGFKYLGLVSWRAFDGGIVYCGVDRDGGISGESK